jgi:hypothetical protein
MMGTTRFNALRVALAHHDRVLRGATPASYLDALRRVADELDNAMGGFNPSLVSDEEDADVVYRATAAIGVMVVVRHVSSAPLGSAHRRVLDGAIPSEVEQAVAAFGAFGFRPIDE